MIKVSIIKISIFLKVKTLIKIIFKLLKQFIKFILFFPSLLLLVLLKIKRKDKKKLLVLRLTKKYLGHLAPESAMASAFQEKNKNLRILTSFKPGKGIDNKYLNSVHSLTFTLKNDFLLIFLNFIYYYSFDFIQILFKKYYEPFLDKNNSEREIRYHDYLETSNNFTWRRIGRSLILNKKNNERNIIIAMRTSHFHAKSKGVSPQPWRDVSTKEIYKIIQAANDLDSDEKVLVFTNKEVWDAINKMEIDLKKISFIDESKNDILDIINADSLLINNGNGIGNAMYALGIKTLYLHHTVWHFWHCTHSNSLAYPCEFNHFQKKPKNIEEIINLAFSSKNIPYNFEKDFYSKGVFHNNISDLSINKIKNSIIETFNIESLKNRKSSKYLGVDFFYSNHKERIFWELFIKNQPSKLRKFRRRISLNIASEFLNSYF